MAARKQPIAGRAWTPEKVRERIKTTLIVKALSNHILNGTEMSKSQVSAALGLLKKTLPDLQMVDATLRGDRANPIVISSTDAEL